MFAVRTRPSSLCSSSVGSLQVGGRQVVTTTWLFLLATWLFLLATWLFLLDRPRLLRVLNHWQQSPIDEAERATTVSAWRM